MMILIVSIDSMLYDRKVFTHMMILIVSIDVVRQKGVYPYDDIDSFNRFSATQLPPKNGFFNRLNDTHISNSQYEHAQRVFQCDVLMDYHDIYFKSDLLLLADSFEKFRCVCLSDYGLDPLHYYTTPGLTWGAALKMSRVNLELITDIDMYNFIEQSMRGVGMYNFIEQSMRGVGMYNFIEQSIRGVGMYNFIEQSIREVDMYNFIEQSIRGVGMYNFIEQSICGVDMYNFIEQSIRGVDMYNFIEQSIRGVDMYNFIEQSIRGVDMYNFIEQSIRGVDMYNFIEQSIRGVDMYNFIEQSIRGGISMISNRYAAKLPDIIKELRTHLIYLYANNLYGWTMSQYFPTYGFKFLTEYVVDF